LRFSHWLGLPSILIHNIPGLDFSVVGVDGMLPSDIVRLLRLIVDVDEVACVRRALNVKPLIVDGGDVGAKHKSSRG